jgi:hypothetical protein
LICARVHDLPDLPFALEMSHLENVADRSPR